MSALMRSLCVLAWLLVAVQVVLLVISTTWFIFAMLVFTLAMAAITTLSVRDFESW